MRLFFKEIASDTILGERTAKNTPILSQQVVFTVHRGKDVIKLVGKVSGVGTHWTTGASIFVQLYDSIYCMKKIRGAHYPYKNHKIEIALRKLGTS